MGTMTGDTAILLLILLAVGVLGLALVALSYGF